MFEIHEKLSISKLSFENQKRNCNLKNFVELKREETPMLHAKHEQFYTEIILPVSTKPINNKSQSTQEQSTHHIEKVHLCDECGKAFMEIAH